MSKIKESFSDKALNHLLESAKVKQEVAKQCLGSIMAAVQLIVDTFESGGKVMICGNGGSAADSQHMAGEFIGILNKTFNRSPLPAIALTTDTSILTAQANDMGFEKIFRRQIEALGKAGDVLVAISTSGSSSNIITGVKAAKLSKILTISLTGINGRLKTITDVAISVPSKNTQYIQESHIAIIHIICELVEYHLFSSKISRTDKIWL